MYTSHHAITKQLYRKQQSLLLLKVLAFKNSMFYDARQHEYQMFGSNNFRINYFMKR